MVSRKRKDNNNLITVESFQRYTEEETSNIGAHKHSSIMTTSS